MTLKFPIFASLALLLAPLAASAAPQTELPVHTLTHLKDALQGETTASKRYELFAQEADKEGYPQVAKLFRAASRSEAIHRENHMNVIRQLGGQIPELKPEAIVVRSTRENLLVPLKGEKAEAETTYPNFISDARMENAPAAVKTFQDARNAEAQHEKLFQDALNNLGRNPPRDYYVNQKTGATLALNPGQPLRIADAGSYSRVG